MRLLSREKKLNLPGRKEEEGRGGKRKKTVYRLENTSNPRHDTQHKKNTEQKNPFASAKTKAVKPDGSACQNVIRDEVIAISSSFATEASRKL